MLLQASWAQVSPHAGTAAELFYQRLLDLDPSLQPLLPRELAVEGTRLIALIDSAVAYGGLDGPLPEAAELGARLARYGITPEHYPTAGRALLWTLEKGLGAGFTRQTREAWQEAFAVLARRMEEGVTATWP